MSRIFRIGTRGSKLARIQTGLVKARLEFAYPNFAFETVVIETRGDRETNRPIAAIGDNALFTREIESALLDGRIDLAVHSMKDLPAACPPGLILAKAWPREDPRDVLVAKDGASRLADLPHGATVATGSPRRDLLLRRLRPDLKIVGIRGNVDTRLRKLFSPASDEPPLDAIVLAAAGLRRLDLTAHVTQCFSVDEMLPAANQGQLAIELRADDVELNALLAALGEDASEGVATAERAFLREIAADCHQPVGAFAELSEGRVSLRCVYARDCESEPVFAAVTAKDPLAAARLAAREIRRQVAGRVTLVGAGPGDPDLITVKGLKAIREADVIVYDRLVADELIKSSPQTCECIYVGKASGEHTLPQSEINELLAKKALLNDRVVRLKGGDPFVFGRGGEEIAYLTERGIRCAVVPGVTSALAAPASVGIPVTHRGVATAFEVVTAHARNDALADIDYGRLLDPRKTCVFLMGLAHIGQIAAGLIAAGRSPDTPAAVIASATTAAAQCVTATLDTIAARTSAARVVSPAVLVVGDTVALRPRLGFPLSGRRYLVPRIGDEPNTYERLLGNLGAEVTAVKVGQIVPRQAALAAVDWTRFTWLALTSRNGLLPFDDENVREVRTRGIRVAAIGQATAAAAEAKGLHVEFIPSRSTGEAFREEFEKRLTPKDRVLHPVAQSCESVLAGHLKEGACETVVAYANEAVPIEGTIDLSQYDAAFFTCSSSARRLYAHARGQTQAVAIGPTTARTLEALGCRGVLIASEMHPEEVVQGGSRF